MLLEEIYDTIGTFQIKCKRILFDDASGNSVSPSGAIGCTVIDCVLKL